MTVTIANRDFDHWTYDAGGDVLYLSVGKPRATTNLHASPEGHALRYDEQGELIGVTIVAAKEIVEREGEIVITLPERVRISPDAIAAALTPVG